MKTHRTAIFFPLIFLFLNLAIYAQELLLVTVSDDRSNRKNGLYEKTQQKIESLFRNNPKFGITKFAMWTYSDIKNTPFYEENKILLDNVQAYRNGRVYKPFVIYEGLLSLNDGDFLIYSDCSPELWDNFNENSVLDKKYNSKIIKDLCIKNGDILTAFVAYPQSGELQHTHSNFTLDRCIQKMDLWKYRSSLQHASGMIVLRKTPKTVAFVKEWVYWNSIDECASLGWADVPEDILFWREEEYDKIGHRHDQSISGLLINRLNNQLIIPPTEHKEINPYNFLQFSRNGIVYQFIDSNITNSEVQKPKQAPKPKIYKKKCSKIRR